MSYNFHTRRPYILRLHPAILIAALVIAFFCSKARADELSITLEGLQTAEGKLMVMVGDAAAFDGKGPAAAQFILPARQGTIKLTTDALPAGDYAIRVMHDVNDNGELDSNLVGMPKEPWGMSNNARGNFGPPKFEDARFALKERAEQTIRVEK
ncbi:MAG: DUF2141 domain-containing protein [Gammaproteobacteria bacterium]|nr:DUF2141 domain-containing protein [Gammaproteobacteria bacterium]